MTSAEGRVEPRWQTAAALGLLLFVAWATLFHRLGASTVNTDPQDESVHSGVAVEMGRTGKFEPTYHGHRYYGKPPLKMWIAGKLTRVLGPTPWALRLPDATAALLTGLLLWGFGRRDLGPVGAVLAPVVLWSSPHFVLLHGAREGVQDAPITLCVTTAVLAWMRAADGTTAWLLLAAAAMSAGVMVKSVVALLPIGIGIAIFVLEGRFRKLLSPWLLVAVALPVLVLFSWMGWHDITHGQGEIRYNVGKRFFAWPKHNYPWWIFASWLHGGLGLWYVPFLAGAVVAVVAILRGPGRRGRIDARALVWALGILVPFSMSKSKLPWYAYPMYPAAALLAARVLAPLSVWRPGGLAALRRVSAAAAAAIALLQVDTVHDGARRVRTSIPVRLYRAIPHPRPQPVLALGIPLDDMCPDEEIHLADEGYELRLVNDLPRVLDGVRRAPGAIVLIAEPDLRAFAQAAGPLMARARVARYAGACEPGPENTPGKRRVLRRALVVFDRPELPPDFAPYAPVELLEGFYAAEPHPEVGQMQWLTMEGTILVGAAGRVRLRFRAMPFHRPRTLDVTLGGQTIARGTITAWRDFETEPFDTGAEGVALHASAGSCDVVRDVVPQTQDRRCLSVALAGLSLVPVP